MNSKLRALLLPILRNAKKSSQFRIRSAADQALFYLKRPPKRAKKVAAARKSAKASQHRDSTASIREAVFQRAGGACELGCGGRLAVELHHLEGGSGRTALQAVSNCIAACWDCHRAYHGSPEDFREAVLIWCKCYGYPVPRRFRGEALTRKAT